MSASWSRRLVCLCVVALALSSTGCQVLGRLGRLGGNFLGGIPGLGGGAIIGGPLGAILDVGGQVITSIITNPPPTPIDAEFNAPGFPQSPFKIVLPANLNPQLVGVLLTPINDIPTCAAIGPDGLLYYTERITGRVRRLNTTNPAAPELVLDLPVNSDGDRGLIGICFTPDGVVPARMFLTYVRSTTNADTTAEAEALESRVSSFPFDNLTLGAETVLCQFPKSDPGFPIPAALQGIGPIGIGPDGKLYFCHGDWNTRLSAFDLNPNNPAGKIHRSNLDGTIPMDNPRAGSTIYAWGFRFPYGLAWDTVAEIFWALDRGNIVSDELNIVEPNVNYGYPGAQGVHNTAFEQGVGILAREPAFDFAAASPLPRPGGIIVLRSPLYPAELQGNVLYTQTANDPVIPIIGPPSPGKVGRVDYVRDRFVVGWGDVWTAPNEAGRAFAIVLDNGGRIIVLCETGIYRLDPAP